MNRPTRIRNIIEPLSDPGVLEAALEDLRQIVIDGLKHGFFEYAITGEMLNENKRRLIIKAGKSHRFIISPEELN